MKDIAVYATLCTYGLLEAGSMLFANSMCDFGRFTRARVFQTCLTPTSLLCAALCYELRLREHKLPKLKLGPEGAAAVESVRERHHAKLHVAGEPFMQMSDATIE